MFRVDRDVLIAIARLEYRAGTARSTRQKIYIRHILTHSDYDKGACKS